MVAKACLKWLRLASHRYSAAHPVSCHQVFALPRELSGGKESFVISTVDGHVQTLDVCTLHAHPPFDSICIDHRWFMRIHVAMLFGLALQAWTGELRGVFGSGGPLVRPSAPPSDSHGDGGKCPATISLLASRKGLFCLGHMVF